MHSSSYRYPVEKLDHIAIGHPDTPDRPRHPELHVIGTAVKVDVPAPGIDLATLIQARLGATQPQDPGVNIQSRSGLTRLSSAL